MKKAICHYSFRRRFTDEKWSLSRLVKEVESYRMDGIDFHSRFLPPPSEAPDAILEAMKGSKLELTGLSLSTNFNQDDRVALKKHIDETKEWIKVAGRVKAPVSRVFGGGVDRSSKAAIGAGLKKVVNALKELVEVAKEANVILALENHSLPGTGEEQVRVIEAVHSPFLKATIDFGNYMTAGDDSVNGTRLASPYCVYVHCKDYKRVEDSDLSSDIAKYKGVILGTGDVPIQECIKVLEKSKYRGYMALEYEAADEENVGIPESVKFMNSILAVKMLSI